MNKENLIKEYKKIPVEYSTGGGMLANYQVGQNKIYVYDGFFKKSEISQIGTLYHEFCHSLYNKFSKEDKILWEEIYEYGKKLGVYISAYAEDQSKFSKGANETFCECGKMIEVARIQKKELKLNSFLDVQLSLAYFLIKKYELQGI